MSFFLSLFLFTTLQDPPLSQEYSFIIEVENNPHDVAQQIETYHPTADVLATYDTIFNGIAIKADERTLQKIKRDIEIKQTYPARTYKTQTNVNKSIPFLFEKELPYTGKGVKVGVIDTGIDYNHPDLEKNFQGGADLVDFDEDPMETKPEQGMPTSHGTHVAGIIAANGKMQGVAPEAELYAYRALGPGGMGSSIQVMAAIEKAVKDEMDIINLSLGNSINGPDWPTSVAVNRATEEGVTVVIANGNTGPDLWTVGSPATAEQVIAVGASTPPIQKPYLFDRFHDKKIDINPVPGSGEWNFSRDRALAFDPKQTTIRDKILLTEPSDTPIQKQVLEAEQQGAAGMLVIMEEGEELQGTFDIDIPVAWIKKDDGSWLQKNANYLEVKYDQIKDTITEFSSRGPVAVNWAIKPEIVAPGAGIFSTVPGGYEAFSGTSMAAPHIAGVLALLKEAHPNWTPAQLKSAILTTADPLETFTPIEQGAGKVNPEQAINTPTLIKDSFLQFGKIVGNSEQSSHTISIENISETPKKYTFQLPKQQQDIRFQLPKSFTLQPNEKKEVTIHATIRNRQMEETLRQGYIYLNDIPLPYMFFNEEQNTPQAMGFELSINPLETHYQYQLYVAKPTKKLTIDLYDASTFEYIRTIAEMEELTTGVLEGEIDMINDLEGDYIINIHTENEDGNTNDYQTEIRIDGQL